MHSLSLIFIRGNSYLFFKYEFTASILSSITRRGDALLHALPSPWQGAGEQLCVEAGSAGFAARLLGSQFLLHLLQAESS